LHVEQRDTRGASVTAKDGHLKGNAGIPGTGLSYQTY
jgi:hypothetical protein